MYERNDSYQSPKQQFVGFFNAHWKKGVAGILGLLVIAFIFSTPYTVTADSQAVIFRFGKLDRTAGPGLHFKLPFGIEEISYVRTAKIFRETFGFGLNKEGNKVNVTKESLMLTGDLSVVDVEWIIQYKVTDPAAFLINVRSPIDLLRDMSEYSTRLVIGDLSFTEALRNRETYRSDIKALLQKELDKVNSGMAIIAVEINDANVPEEVKKSYNAVNTAQQEKESMIYAAKQQANDKIPEALGVAKATVDKARGEATSIINESKGRVARFLSIYNEYIKAKDITATRMYLDTMRGVLSNTELIIVDGDLKGVLPIMNIDKGGK
jgi:membrane protease subunit HflK